MNVILCGYNWIGCSALNYLMKRGYNVYVYTHESPPHINSLKDYCQKLGVNHSIEKITINNLPFTPDMICSIYYRYIIPELVINAVDGKIFNLHPSLLPKYKGCSSLTWAMIEGEKEVGFTYHFITRSIDEGRIITQKKIDIYDWDTQITLYHRVMFEASKLFNNVLDLVLSGYKGIDQTPGGKYFKRGCPHNGEINMEWSFDKQERFVRALNYPPLPYATIEGTEIRSYFELRKYLEDTKEK